MAYTKATAPNGQRTSEILSADNGIPERHVVIATLRNAAPRLGLTASVISTLDAMLSCLAPKRDHHTVFASNATLTFRCNGISDRTIRRHAAALQDCGLLERRDSPNRKRFTKHNRHAGQALRFGFDLSPLFARLHEFAALAAEVLREKEHIDYLRCKIRAGANMALETDPSDPDALEALRMLRRKLTVVDCESLLIRQRISPVETKTLETETAFETASVTTNDGQNVRHHHKSNKELIDKESAAQKKQVTDAGIDRPITVTDLLIACPEAAQFALRRIETVHDVVAHARTLAPMIGISMQSYDAAHERLGALRAAATVWAIMQFHDRIKTVGAYFRSITTGAKSAEFSPEKLIRRLAAAQTSTP